MAIPRNHNHSVWKPVASRILFVELRARMWSGLSTPPPLWSELVNSTAPTLLATTSPTIGTTSATRIHLGRRGGASIISSSSVIGCHQGGWESSSLRCDRVLDQCQRERVTSGIV